MGPSYNTNTLIPFGVNWTKNMATRGKLVNFWTKICNAEYYFLYAATVLIKPVNFMYKILRIMFFFLKYGWFFSKMTPHQNNLLILRDIVWPWDYHTNSLIPFGENQTENMATRTKNLLQGTFVPLKNYILAPGGQNMCHQKF